MELRDPGGRWYHVRLPRADTFSTWTPGSAVITLATRGPNGKRELVLRRVRGRFSVPARYSFGLVRLPPYQGPQACPGGRQSRWRQASRCADPAPAASSPRPPKQAISTINHTFLHGLTKTSQNFVRSGVTSTVVNAHNRQSEICQRTRVDGHASRRIHPQEPNGGSLHA